MFARRNARRWQLSILYSSRIHQCPQTSWGGTYRSRSGIFREKQKSLKSKAKKVAKRLRLVIQEVDYGARKDLSGICGTMLRFLSTTGRQPWWTPCPYGCRRPTAPTCIRSFISPSTKRAYSRCNSASHSSVTLCSGLGRTSESQLIFLFREGTWKHHPFCSWERWLADLGYVGARGLLVKYKGDDVNSAARLLFNNVHEHVRETALWRGPSSGH